MRFTFIYHRTHKLSIRKKLLKQHKIIRNFDLRNYHNMVRISIDVKLKSRKDLYLTPELETAAIENPLYQGSTFEYEGLD